MSHMYCILVQTAPHTYITQEFNHHTPYTCHEPEFCRLGKSVFLCNRSRWVCYNSTHDHRSPGKPIRFGSWIYPGFRGQSHMETPRNWTFVIGWVYEVRIASSHSYSLRFSVYYEYIDGTTCKYRDECAQLIVYVLRCSENRLLIRELKVWEVNVRG